jgi:hypothetical protein
MNRPLKTATTLLALAMAAGYVTLARALDGATSRIRIYNTGRRSR